MKTPPTPNRQPLPVELLISADERRDPQHVSAVIPGVIADFAQRVTVEAHQKFREAIATPPPFEEIDDAVADMPTVFETVAGVSRRRSQKEISRVLEILDNIDREGREH